ncbi:RNA polymerase sigma factor SigM [Propionicicella superfundia]|uniref:RNA polymerase sigma factor SigM n=1 Tax=Propionicicella superfundia TaxID=348582 RepID=UPI000400AEBB|nr:RNA polymerase sigma factor SigM [Propionicicella superfundia]
MSTPSERSDEDLLRAHVAGDPAAFGTLVRRHESQLWAVALRTVRNGEDASDVLQEAMVSAFRRAAGFRGDAAVLTWLHRIVINAGLDRLRRNKVRRAEPLPDDLDRTTLLTAPCTADDAILRHELRADIVAALGRINADQRAAIVLVDMDGYSVEEAARILGCAVGTVKSRCSRGRAKLAPLLAHLKESRV